MSRTAPTPADPTGAAIAPLDAARPAGDRAPVWRRLERLLGHVDQSRNKKIRGQEVTELCRLHRATSRDLSQAIAEGKPETTVRYLHGLVSRTHALLYRFESVEWHRWREALFVSVPRKLYRDPYLRVAFVVFFGTSLLSYLLATVTPEWTDVVLGPEMKSSLDSMYSGLGEVRNLDESFYMSGFYVRNNMTVALRCFAYGIFLGIGSVVALLTNALTIGASFGYMLAGSYSDNFLSFVVGHAPFELTAVTFAGAAGLKLGLSLVRTQGWSRAASLRRAALDSVALVTSACLLLLGAALIEAFFSPLPYPVTFKLPIFLLTLTLLVAYVLVLGGRGDPEPGRAP
ncbi:MAG: stage II sporulation protein M [Deltaproteobacteria bacterium]|nr:stage II sporulation protein M [Deltaproteobacteria bacterium]